MPELSPPSEDLQLQLEELRQSELLLRQQHVVLLRQALYQHDPENCFEEKQRQLTKEIGNFLEVERTSIWFFDQDDQVLRCLSLYVRSEDAHYSGDELDVRQLPRYLDALSHCTAIQASDARRDPRTAEFDEEYLSKHGIVSMLDVPLNVGNRLRGVLCCEHVGEPREWEGQDLRFVVSLADLASLSLATRDALQNEETLRVLLDALPHGIVAVNERNRIVLVNSSLEKIYGYARTDLLGESADKLFPCGVFGDGQSLFDYSRTHQSSTDRPGEYQKGYRHDGSEFPYELSVSHVYHQGGEIALAILNDMSQRVAFESRLRKSEELYRTVVEDQIDKIARYTPEGIRTFANDAYCKFASKSRSELIGACLWDELKIHDLQRMKDNFGSLSLDNPVLSYENSDVLPNGEIVINQWLDRALFDANGRVREIQSIGRDVTRQRETEERLRSAQRLESLAMMASGIAHDFNNLLTPILIYSENLQQRLKSSSIEANQAAQIQLAAEKARDLVKQILTFGRKSESASHIYRPFGETFRDLLLLLRSSTPYGIKLEAGFDENCGIVEATATELYQILSNLYRNACQSMPQGGTVRISASRVAPTATSAERQQTFVRIVVQDSGCGMPPEVSNRVFDPFFSTKPAGEGTGLGLSVTHGIVVQLGGSIEVESRIGAGTTFTVQLPTVESKQVIPTKTAAHVIAAPRPARILLVDDDQMALKSMRLVLKQLGHKVTAFNTAPRALESLFENPVAYDLLISDVTMPGMGGLELAEHVHRLRSDLPIVLVTGDSGMFDFDQLCERGVVEFLSKPVSGEQLQAAVDTALHGETEPVASQPEPPAPPAGSDDFVAVGSALVIDDDEMVCRSLKSLLRSWEWQAIGVESIAEAEQALAERSFDVVMVDHHLRGENGFERVARLFDTSHTAGQLRPLLIGITGSESLKDIPGVGLDAYLAKPFSADELRALLPE